MRLTALLLIALTACSKGEPDPTPWCSALQPAPAPSNATPAPTWWRDVRPIVTAKCAGCHNAGGIGPMRLDSYAQVFQYRDAVTDAVQSRRMPPWLAARCCASYHDDRSLTDGELGTLLQFLAAGAPEGDAATATPVAQGSLLSRVDVSVQMPEPYFPSPPEGRADENRCFLIDWPFDSPKFVTGFAPKPGNREIVHHILVWAVSGEDLKLAADLDAKDEGPGFDCGSVLGAFRSAQVLGGSLLGGDFPRGIGQEVGPGSKVLLNVHYSLSHATSNTPDRTGIDFRIDGSARDARTIAMANPAWLVADAMEVKAGAEDVPYFFQFRPSGIFTARKRVMLQGVTPHMHAFASRIVVRIVRANGDRQCLLEIPEWRFGWEQPFWFAEEIPLERDDELYLECRFDNTAEKYGPGREPRDIAWGAEDQDMCAAFLSFTPEK